MVSQPPRPNEESTAKRGRPQSKRDEIVSAAVRVFLENGYAATSMNRVADEAGVIKATIYSHFKDKEQLFTAIFEELVLKKVAFDFEKLEPTIIAMSLDEFLDTFWTRFHILENDPEYPTLLRLLIGESGRFPELAEIYTKLIVNKAILLAKKYFDSHPEYGFEDTLAAAHCVCGVFISRFLWQRVLGAEKTITLESERIKAVILDLYKSKAANFAKPSE